MIHVAMVHCPYRTVYGTCQQVTLQPCSWQAQRAVLQLHICVRPELRLCKGYSSLTRP